MRRIFALAAAHASPPFGGCYRLDVRSNFLDRAVVSARSSLLAATPSVSRSHLSSGSKPFSLKNTGQVASAVRLLPSING